MKLKEQLRMLVILLAMPLAFVACDNNDDENGAPIVAEKGVFVFNSGNQASGIDGTLSFIDEKTETVSNNVFETTNERKLGSTVQDGVILGNNLYIAVSKSNTIEVVNKNTLVSVVQIVPTPAQGNTPRDIVTDGKYVYVSMYTGVVSRIDPSTNTIDKTVAVGPNPEEMVIVNKSLYVTNSDGNNYNAGYANGKSVSKISLSDFVEEKKIAVGLNPTKITADVLGNVLVLCMGDYSATPATVWKINAEDEATSMNIPATIMDIKDNSLYVINAPYGAPSITYTVYNTSSGAVEKKNFVSAPVDAPAGIAVHSDGRIFITSYTLVGGFASYKTPGYVSEYSSDGTFVKKYDVGVGAVSMTFLK